MCTEFLSEGALHTRTQFAPEARPQPGGSCRIQQEDEISPKAQKPVRSWLPKHHALLSSTLLITNKRTLALDIPFRQNLSDLLMHWQWILKVTSQGRSFISGTLVELTSLCWGCKLLSLPLWMDVNSHYCRGLSKLWSHRKVKHLPCTWGRAANSCLHILICQHSIAASKMLLFGKSWLSCTSWTSLGSWDPSHTSVSTICCFISAKTPLSLSWLSGKHPHIISDPIQGWGLHIHELHNN